MSEVEPTGKSSAMERHVQTILVSLITAGIVYIVTANITNDRAQAAEKVTLEFISRQLIDLQADVKTIQQNQNGYVRQEQYADHEVRLRALEKGFPK